MRYNPFARSLYLHIDIRYDEAPLRRVIGLIFSGVLITLGGAFVAMVCAIASIFKAAALLPQHAATAHTVAVPLLCAACMFILLLMADALVTQLRLLIAARDLARLAHRLAPHVPELPRP